MKAKKHVHAPWTILLTNLGAPPQAERLEGGCAGSYLSKGACFGADVQLEACKVLEATQGICLCVCEWHPAKVQTGDEGKPAGSRVRGREVACTGLQLGFTMTHWNLIHTAHPPRSHPARQRSRRCQGCD
jgi:hypothetical protein